MISIEGFVLYQLATQLEIEIIFMIDHNYKQSLTNL